VAVLAVALSAAPAQADVRAGVGAGAFSERLRRAGRAVAAFERTATDLLDGTRTAASGTVTLEAAGRASVAFSTGERVVVRGDGGEWLQPALRQMIRLGPAGAARARSWWDAVLAAEGGARSRDGRQVLRSADGADSAFVTWGRGGLPTRLDYQEGAVRVSFRFRSWRFSAARGDAAFRITAPRGYEVVDLP
jgi:hypothetical protein